MSTELIWTAFADEMEKCAWKGKALAALTGAGLLGIGAQAKKQHDEIQAFRQRADAKRVRNKAHRDANPMESTVYPIPVGGGSVGRQEPLSTPVRTGGGRLNLLGSVEPRKLPPLSAEEIKNLPRYKDMVPERTDQ